MTHLDSFPTTAGLHRALSRFAGARAFLVPMTDAHGKILGNNGDTLMHRVFDELLRELQITKAATRSDADLVVVPPSGALLESYAFPRLLAERLQGFESTPLVVFPSSAYFPTTDPSFMFRGRSAETILLLREARSLSHLAGQWGTALSTVGVDIILDHDVVAAGHAYVPAIIGRPARDAHLLIAARRDKESSANHLASTGGDRRVVRARNAVVKAIPYGRVRTAVTRAARRGANDAASASLLAEVPAELRADLIESRRSRSTIRIDASANQFATFAEYARLVADAEVVVTNRLHVGLPAAILGKPVVLVEGGYFKLQGVYERSLSGLENVHMITHAKVGRE